MKKAANVLACEQAQLCDFRGNVGAGPQPRAGVAGEKNRTRKLTSHFSSLIRQLALAVAPQNIFPKLGRLQTYAYLESIMIVFMARFTQFMVWRENNWQSFKDNQFTYLNYTEIGYFLVKKEKKKTKACLIWIRNEQEQKRMKCSALICEPTRIEV